MVEVGFLNSFASGKPNMTDMRANMVEDMMVVTMVD